MKQRKLVLVNLLMVLIFADFSNSMVEGILAGSGRYGYGRRETKVSKIFSPYKRGEPGVYHENCG